MNELRKWVGNAQMTQREFAIEFEIPLRTVEDWMTGKSNPAPYLTKLLIEKLQSITEKRFVERAWKKANTLKSDENGRRPAGSWAIVEQNAGDEFVTFYDSMKEAIRFWNQSKDCVVAYILCN